MPDAPSNPTQAARAADTLREEILSGVVLPGDRLVEATWAARLGVSQATVRDALRQLEEEGWAVKEARRGTRVRAFTAREAEELYQLLGAVMRLALSWAMPQMRRATLRALQRHVDAARLYTQTDRARDAVEAVFALHQHITTLAARPQTQALLVRLLNQARLLEVLRRARRPRTRQEQQAQIAAHQALVDALAARDHDAAEHALAHIIALEWAGTHSAVYA